MITGITERRQSFRIFSLAVLALATTSLASQSETEELVERARTRPELIEGLGTTEFAITCAEPRCGLYFNQGVAWLHGSDPRQADRCFFEAVSIEPDCAMAWWGLAIANLDLGDTDAAARYAERAADRARGSSPRERMWVDLLSGLLDETTSELDRRAYMVRSLDRIAAEYPGDIEARAFLVRQLVDNRAAGMRVPLIAAVDAMLAELLRDHPEHPAQRYRLQLWLADHPERALASARAMLSSPLAMPRALADAGRVYSRLGRDDEAIRCFQASLAAARGQLDRERIMPTQVAGYVESALLLVRHLARVGRRAEAVALARHLIELPAPAAADDEPSDEPRDEPRDEGVAPDTGGGHGAHTATLEKDEVSPTILGQRALIDVLMDFHSWDELRAAAGSAHLASTDPDIRARRSHALGLAHFAAADSPALARELANLRLVSSLAPASMTLPEQREFWRRTRSQVAELEGCATALAGTTGAAAGGRSIPTDQRAAPLPPGGASDEALSLARRAVELRPGHAGPELELVRVLRSRGDAHAATEELARLRRRYPDIDPDLLPAGTGSPATALTLAGSSWQPRAAPRLSLRDRHDSTVSLANLRGTPVVLVFYLGAGCAHCIEQLQSFAPLGKDYEQAGIRIIAVSTDSVPGLQATFDVAGGGDVAPFTLVSDEPLEVFRAFGAFDARKDEPLHGTFLIDPRGRILWQDISSAPFMATRELLEEARRVLALDESRPAETSPFVPDPIPSD